MTYKDFFNENNMSQVPIGGNPTMSGGSGTYASPDVRQNPGSFPSDTSRVNMLPPTDFAVKPKLDPDEYKKDVDAVKTKVSPDDIISGMEYEMKKQVFKNKSLAKETVVQNLKKDPKFYRELKMMGNTEDMMTETKQNDALLQIIKDMSQKSQYRGEKVQSGYGNFDKIKELMDQKWEEKKKMRNNGN